MRRWESLRTISAFLPHRRIRRISWASVPALLSGKRVAIERTPRLSERDVVAFYPYPGKDGSFGALFQLDDHGRIALDALSIEKRGQFSVGVLDRPIDEQALKEALADFP